MLARRAGFGFISTFWIGYSPRPHYILRAHLHRTDQRIKIDVEEGTTYHSTVTASPNCKLGENWTHLDDLNFMHETQKRMWYSGVLTRKCAVVLTLAGWWYKITECVLRLHNLCQLTSAVTHEDVNPWQRVRKYSGSFPTCTWNWIEWMLLLGVG